MPRVDFSGAEIAYELRGHGPLVVLLHATANSSRQWDKLVDRIADRYTALAVDLHGHGASDAWTGGKAMTLDDEAAALDAVLAQIGAPYHLIGHSYGGAVALKKAASEQDRLLSLTLIEPASFHLLRGRGGDDLFCLTDIANVAEAVSKAAVNGDQQRALSTFIDYWNGHGTWHGLNPESRRALCRQIGTIALNFWTTLRDPLRADALAKIAVPTLVLAGEATTRAARRIAELIATHLVRARLDLIEGAGHMLPLTHPESVNWAIETHLQETEGARTQPRRLCAA